MKLHKTPSIAWASLAAMAIYAPQLYAYLDPVTGSMLIQGLIGAIAGAAVAIKLYWRRLKAWFARVTGREIVAAENTTEKPRSDSTVAENK